MPTGTTPAPALRRSAALLLVVVLLGTGCGTLCWSTLDLLENQKDEDDVFESEPLNFRYRYPGNPYLDLGAEKHNEDSELELFAFGPMVHFQIIAEEANEPLDARTVAKTARKNLLKGAPDASSSPPQPWQQGDLKGLRFASTGLVEGRDGHWQHFIVARNGFVYQLVASSRVESADVVAREAERLFAGFSLIDPARRSSRLGGEPFGRRRMAAHPWEIDLQGDAFESLSTESVDLLVEVMGRSSEHPVYFALTPLRLEAPLPRRAALEQLAMMTLEWQEAHSEAVPLANRDEGGETRLRLGLVRMIDGEAMHYVFGIAARGQNAVLLAVWGKDERLVRRDSDVLLGAVAFRAGAPAWRFENLPARLQRAHVAGHGLIAQHYLDTKNFTDALPWLRAASRRAPDDFDALARLMRTLAALDEPAAALAALASAPSALQEGQLGRSWQAWLLIKAGERAAGRALFARLFDEGYRDDNDFRAYVEVLEADEGIDAAAKAYASYRARQSNEALALGHAELFARHERYRDAVEVLRAAQDGKTLSPKIMFAVIHYELELGRGEEALAIVEHLEESGYGSSDTHYFRGRALLAQGRLEEARSAFLEAKKLAPDDEGLDRWIAHVDELLGDG